jgi:hypothetical protein
MIINHRPKPCTRKSVYIHFAIGSNYLNHACKMKDFELEYLSQLSIKQKK